MLEWFTTIPGILVICGVILLVIAIILFAVSAKKDKKENMVNEQVSNNIEPVVETPVSTVTEVKDTPQVVNTQVVEETVNNNLEIAAPALDAVEPVVEPVAEPVIEPVQPAVEENVTPVVQEETIPEVVDAKALEEVNVNTNDANAIYGGQQPIVDFVSEEKPVTIYGGNDPLEATQKLPLVEENHVPYGGEYPEIKIPDTVVEPVVTPVQPVVEAVTPISTPEFNTFSQPEVVSIPAMDEVLPDTVVEPVVEPVVQPVQSVVEEKVIPVVEEL